MVVGHIDLPMAEVALQTGCGYGCRGVLLVILCLNDDCKRVGKDTYHPLKLISESLLQIRQLSIEQ